MALRIKSITFDCADPCRLARFWRQLTVSVKTGQRQRSRRPGGSAARLATEQPADLPDDLAAQSLAFTRTQLTEQARPVASAPAQIFAEHAPAIERLVAFLGRPVNTER